MTDISRKGRTKDKSVAIIGGGLVGALQACFLAKRGYKVDVYEMRQDIRLQEAVAGRSINLAVSHRGREALRAVGAEEEIVKNGVPMFGRMIHGLDGSRHPIYYGRKDQYILSVDRRRLNELLLTIAEGYPDVTLHFNHKLTSCDFNTGELVFKRSSDSSQRNQHGEVKGQSAGTMDQTRELIRKKSDLMIGCDGAYSAVRNEMLKRTRMNYSQEYIPHGYIELTIPATPDHQFAMEKNYLHIWPRHTFMLIALANVKDKSFVLTLFMPFDIFEGLTDDAKLIHFFEEKFPDALELIGRDSLVKTFFKLTPLSLVSIKCESYHIGDKAIILGDAAHAMVPFYGQGLNCGFEDLLVFNELMDQYNDDFGKVLSEFTTTRRVDVQTMNDLAMYNYIEMRSSVNSKLFIIRKKLDNFLYWLLPKTWIPLYTMVAFTRIRYHECMARKAWQDKILRHLVLTVGATGIVALTLTLYPLMSGRQGNVILEKISNLGSTLLTQFKDIWK